MSTDNYPMTQEGFNQMRKDYDLNFDKMCLYHKDPERQAEHIACVRREAELNAINIRMRMELYGDYSVTVVGTTNPPNRKWETPNWRNEKGYKGKARKFKEAR